MSTPQTVDPSVLLDQIEARANAMGRWPTMAELGQMRHDTRTLVAALRAVQEVARDADRYQLTRAVAGGHIRHAIRTHLGGTR